MSNVLGVTIINTSIIAAIVMISTLGFLVGHTPAGLWSMLMMFGFMRTKETLTQDPNNE